MILDNSVNNKRIAKNTLLLFIRTVFILIISLFTSRVILNALGVDDFGIYNAVGGVVAMFGVISGALSASISRFLTFELGKGNIERLKTIFSTSVNIQFGLALIILVIGEIIGVWFLNCKMNIPESRMIAANWVLHCSLLTFCVNLISIPYNACLIAHEKMDVFAYISILEAFLKLAICYLIMIATADRLIMYFCLLLAVAVLIRIIYGIYCHKKFEESRYKMVFDKPILKEMTNFAGWSFFTNASFICNTQGVTLLTNVFFGVSVNAARGIATQVEAAVNQLVNSFTTALNPQITKNYAVGRIEEMVSLVCRGAKFSYFLMFICALPILIETDYILAIWLKLVPDHSVSFVRLAIVGSLINVIGKTGYTASMATGNIKRYVLWVTTIGSLALPITWLVFEIGEEPESMYIVFIVVYTVVEGVRLWVMKGLLGFPVIRFVKDVFLKILIVTVTSLIFPILIVSLLEPSFLRFILTSVVCILSSTFFIYMIGLTRNEKTVILSTFLNKIRSII